MPNIYKGDIGFKGQQAQLIQGKNIGENLNYSVNSGTLLLTDKKSGEMFSYVDDPQKLEDYSAGRLKTTSPPLYCPDCAAQLIGFHRGKRKITIPFCPLCAPTNLENYSSLTCNAHENNAIRHFEAELTGSQYYPVGEGHILGDITSDAQYTPLGANAEEFGVEYVGRRPCYTYRQVSQTIEALHDAGKINLGLASPSYGKYVGWLPSRLTGEDVLSGGSMEDSHYQPEFHIGDWGYGRNTKTPKAWFNQIKAGLDGDIINDYGRTDVQLFEDGWYEGDSEPDNYGPEYSDGVECSCGAKDMIALSRGSVHSCTYHAGEILGMAHYDRKVIMQHLKKSFSAEEITMSAEYDSPYGERQTTTFGLVGGGNDFAQNRAESLMDTTSDEVMPFGVIGGGNDFGQNLAEDFGSEYHLTDAERNRLPKSDFAMPSERKYPMPNTYYAKKALTYAKWPNNRGDLREVERNVLNKYPSLDGWWSKHRPKNAETFGAESKGTSMWMMAAMAAVGFVAGISFKDMNTDIDSQES